MAALEIKKRGDYWKVLEGEQELSSHLTMQVAIQAAKNRVRYNWGSVRWTNGDGSVSFVDYDTRSK